ncbi:TolC family protein [Algimonas arctica]|nr:TolC family protein [Algimonas arctica]
MSAFVLIGCATSPNGAETEINALNGTIPVSALGRIADHPAESFADLLPDPLLADYLATALTGNNSVEQARIAVEAADLRLTQSRARRGPFIGLSGSTGASTGLDDFDLNDSARLGASLSFDPDIFGEIRATVHGSQAQLFLRQAELARLQRAILARTAQAYVQAIETDLQLALAQENFEFLGETLRVSRARFEAGDIARSDYALSEAEYENSRASLFAQQLGARESRRTLADLVGRYDVETLPVATTLPPIAAQHATIRATADRAVLARYDIEAQRLAVVSAAANLDATKASTLPGISLSGSAGGGLSLSDLFDIDTYVTSLSAAISDTVFDNGLDTARIAESRTRLDAALATYSEALRDAYRDVISSLDRLEVFQTRLIALDAASRAAGQALELEQVRFDLGEAILLDVLTVQRRVNTIQSSRIREESAIRTALIDAYLAAGPAR